MADVAIALVYPDLLGTYGDGGNARILAERLRWRGIGAEVTTVTVSMAVPRGADVYVLGGGEDRPQSLAASRLREDGGLASAVEGGASVLAVCAGLQVLGTRFLTADGVVEGAGVADVETTRRLDVRAVGELAVDPRPELGLPRLSGYENHAGASVLGSGVEALGRVVAGTGNGDGADGFVAGKVLGTYLHGPVLARNPELADLVLEWVTGPLPPLEKPDADEEARGLRAERLAAVASGQTRRWWRFAYPRGT